VNNKRPVNLNLMTIRFPLTAIVSILHRISGVLLFLAIPLLLWLFQLSLNSAHDFHYVVALLTGSLMKLVTLILLASLVYHLLAGIRHLLMDVGIGESLQLGRLGARLVLGASIIFTLVIGAWLW